MRSRQRLLQVALWDTVQAFIRDTNYKTVSKSLTKVCNKQEKKDIITDINDSDRNIIKFELSKIAEVLDI